MNEIQAIASTDAVYLDTCALAKIDCEEEGSRFVRVLVYMSTLKKYTSWVGLGEWIGVIARKIQMASDEAFLFTCRQMFKEFEIQHFRFVEPPDDRPTFIRLSRRLLKSYPKLDGTDLWHLMAALELKKAIPSTVFFSFDDDLVISALAEGLNAVNGKGLSEQALDHELQKTGKKIGE